LNFFNSERSQGLQFKSSTEDILLSKKLFDTGFKRGF
jgi:hypothetical protein